jgi:Cu/Ag efflux protein CusF
MKRLWLILAAPALGLALLSGCAKVPAPPPETHSSTGVVVEVRPGVLVIQHQDFPGFMKAMTMPFELADTGLAQGIAPGDKVAFTLTKTGQGYPLTAIQKLP